MSTLQLRMASLYLLVALVFGCFSVITGEKCEDVRGYWYNTLGSEMYLTDHGENGEMRGEYRTAVERKPGAAGDSHSNLTGAGPYNTPGATIGFMVSWRGGKSTTVWTGQCIICNGEEVIVTTWLLRSLVDTCIDKWKSTYIGQDYFTRHEQAIGPRRRFGTHTPQGYNPDGTTGRRKRDVFERQVDQPLRIRRQVSEGQKPCALDGTWYNLIGSKVELTERPDHNIEGEYHTAREVYDGESGGHHSRIYGVGNYQEEDHTFAMVVSWRDGVSITGWVGQCHICSDSNNRTEELVEMAWLHRSQVTSCAANWKSTQHGQNTFFRKVQAPAARASNDVIGEFGEDSVTSTGPKINLSYILFFLPIISAKNYVM